MIENFYRTYDGKIERKRKWDVCFVWFISNTFLFSYIFSSVLGFEENVMHKGS